MGLTAALALHSQWGTVPERYHRICQLSHYLWQQLQTLPGITCLGSTAPDAGLISFQVSQLQANSSPTQTHQSLVNFLEARGILVRSIPYPNCVRVGVHYFTLVEDCDRLVAEIAAFEMT
jgi:L-cysteine/cystine lyase